MSYSAKTKIIRSGKGTHFACPICKFVLRDLEDTISTKNHGGCTNCITNFKFNNIKKWENGWRPSIEEARTH